MPRTTYVWRDSVGIIEKHLAPPKSGVFHVIRDGMDPTVHPATGKLMDSKSEFRRVTRAHGCIEVGNEPMVSRAPVYDRADLVQDIKRAIEAPHYRPAEPASRYIEDYD